jgi:hypothetical protein
MYRVLEHVYKGVLEHVYKGVLEHVYKGVLEHVYKGVLEHEKLRENYFIQCMKYKRTKHINHHITVITVYHCDIFDKFKFR